MAQYIKRIGMYKTKSKNIVGLAKSLVENFGGQVPDDYGALVSLREWAERQPMLSSLWASGIRG